MSADIGPRSPFDFREIKKSMTRPGQYQLGDPMNAASGSSRQRLFRWFLAIVVITPMIGCGGGSSGGGGGGGGTSPSTVSIASFSGNGQTGAPGTMLSMPLAVVLEENGAPAPGVAVDFALTAGSAALSSPSSVSDSTGKAEIMVTLGASPGSVGIVATVGGSAVNFTATILAQPSLVIVSGDGQIGPVGTPLTQPLVVERRSSLGLPVSGVAISFSTMGNTVASPMSSVTDGMGQASATVVFGSMVGPVTVTASDGTRSVTFALTAVGGGGSTSLFAEALSSPLAVGGNAPAIAAGDLDGDGRADLAVPLEASDQTLVFLGTPTGFMAASGSPLATSQGPVGVAISDLNGDGLNDVVTINRSGRDLSIYHSQAGGGLQRQADQLLATRNGTVRTAQIVVSDIDGIGSLDLVARRCPISPQSFQGTIDVLAASGPSYVAIGGSPISANGAGSAGRVLGTGDFNSDGRTDIVSADELNGGASLAVLLQGASGQFTTLLTLNTADDPEFLACGDVNNDGRDDIVVVSGGTAGNLEVFLQSTGGTLSTTASLSFGAPGRPTGVLVADLNNDGRNDIASCGEGQDQVEVLLQTLSSSFISASGSPFSVVNAPTSLAAGDFDGDGKVDLAVAGDGITILLGQ